MTTGHISDCNCLRCLSSRGKDFTEAIEKSAGQQSQLNSGVAQQAASKNNATGAGIGMGSVGGIPPIAQGYEGRAGGLQPVADSEMRKALDAEISDFFDNPNAWKHMSLGNIVRQRITRMGQVAWQLGVDSVRGAHAVAIEKERNYYRGLLNDASTFAQTQKEKERTLRNRASELAHEVDKLRIARAEVSAERDVLQGRVSALEHMNREAREEATAWKEAYNLRQHGKAEPTGVEKADAEDVAKAPAGGYSLSQRNRERLTAVCDAFTRVLKDIK